MQARDVREDSGGEQLVERWQGRYQQRDCHAQVEAARAPRIREPSAQRTADQRPDTDARKTQHGQQQCGQYHVRGVMLDRDIALIDTVHALGLIH